MGIENTFVVVFVDDTNIVAVKNLSVWPRIGDCVYFADEKEQKALIDCDEKTINKWYPEKGKVKFPDTMWIVIGVLHSFIYESVPTIFVAMQRYEGIFGLHGQRRS